MAGATGGINAQTLNRIATAIRAGNTKAAMEAARVAVFYKEAVADHGINRWALRTAIKLTAMRSDKGQANFRALEQYCHLLRLFDQVDLIEESVMTIHELEGVEVRTKELTG